MGCALLLLVAIGRLAALAFVLVATGCHVLFVMLLHRCTVSLFSFSFAVAVVRATAAVGVVRVHCGLS
jgi:hypothetical protein